VSTQRLYLIAGFLWALLLGPAVALAVAAASAGAAWLFIFGDDPWPPVAQWFILLSAIGGGLVAAAAALWSGYQLSRWKQSHRPATVVDERRRAIVLLVVPITLILVIAAKVWFDANSYRRALEIASQREAAFADLVGDSQAVVAISIKQTSGDTLQAIVRTAGEREGKHRLTWLVMPSSSDHVLLDGSRDLKLDRGNSEIPLAISMRNLAGRYREIVLGGQGGVLVDEPFRLTVVIEPILTRAEATNLPPGELRRLGTTDSPLRSEQTAFFPVHFTIAR
jgi:hypothetical protein